MASNEANLELLMRLLELRGPSGDEGQVADFIAKSLRRARIPANKIRTDRAHRKSALGGNQGNLILKLPGSRRAPRRLFSAHMDTVPICAGARPVVRRNRVVPVDSSTGLGGDDRAGCAVLLNTALQIASGDASHPPLTFVWTVQEEVGLHGSRHLQLSALGKPAVAFNFDGGAANEVTIGATGGYRMEIDALGLASHAGGRPERGVSAIAIAALAISDLVENGWHGLVEKGRRRGTSNVGVIEGGQATNVVTDKVRLKAEARSHDPRFRKRIVSEIEKAFRNAARRLKNSDGVSGKVEFQGRLDYESFALNRSDPVVAITAAAIEAEGLSPDYRIANGGLDANWLNAHGIPTASLGCGQNAIHMAGEWLNLDEYQRACRLALRLATGTS